MRKRIYVIIEVSKDSDLVSKIYDIFMMVVIFASLIPLAFKEQTTVFLWLDKITVMIFIVDYLLRLITADYKLNSKGKAAILIYPFTPMAIIDLLSILPSMTILNSGFKLLKIFRLLRTFRVFRVFKAVRYSKNIMLILSVLKRQKDSLLVVLWLALAYVLVSALVIFNVEPQTFDSFFDAVYWATISLTTMGYGDIYPVSTAGQVITMLSSVLGIAIVALPASIITTGYMKEVNSDK
ncbi:ion transporter [Eubacterium sp. AF17-7]|jgi:voltage-gated potassium channel|uniref:ion transporter n=1 Tax=Eubacterium sp. AF17-7 TaxID=2293105 RepID=UPI000E513D7A|nr:ion transporter [Eubacterium sp. AF17-7]RGG67638.1 ion transporter [Eubacterium sp. AF17-7]